MENKGRLPMSRPRQEPMELKIGILVSYDYYFVVPCLRNVYEHVDRIVLAVDKDRRTWNGQPFELPVQFFSDITALDRDKKITVFEESFFLPGLAPMECDTRERRMVAEVLGPGGWHIQIDADETFLDFPLFVAFLRDLERRGISRRPICVYAYWVTLFKRTENGVFYVSSGERFPVATNTPRYIKARQIDKSVAVVQSDFLAMHDSWARSRGDLHKKLKNWSHSDDFSTDRYMAFWDSVDENNYQYLRDIHPLAPEKWGRLEFAAGGEEAVWKMMAATQPRHGKLSQHVVRPSRGWLRRVTEALVPPVLFNGFARVFQRLARSVRTKA